MFDKLVEFEWFRDASGYDLDSTGSTKKIIRRGGVLTPYQPMSRTDKLVEIFANVRNEEQLYGFIQRWGPLTREGLLARDDGETRVATELSLRGKEVIGYVTVGDEVSTLLNTATWFSNVVKYRKTKSPKFFEVIERFKTDPSNFDLKFEPHALYGVRISISPYTLLDALKLSLAQMLETGRLPTDCKQCGDLFSFKRSDAKYCSDKCKDDYNNNHKRLRLI